MTASRRTDHPDAGFTLLEMLVVLTILGLVAAIAAPALTRPSDNVKLAAAAREITGALRLTRSAAIARNNEQVLLIDVDRRIYTASFAAERRFPADIKAKLKVAEPERISASRGGIRFFPDGSSTGGEMVLSLRDRHVKLCVHWLTGQPVLEGEC